ncbi:hypothetical protein B0T26DRAFT_637290 [Lasiosphaeria miniovina]|uniref:Uncharacterized protein n=1 Tax=Lasiosphaeria miniovina TaxID=1954250 RepID=A0AA40B5G8_9PEZI|nr:uncharacterized protein B0T26DRAFT_637290 [Lasiosphaeria miniovina]KAK0728056.1 hypothetical protein B0T26DRAFT_637290 [Lasiosphaeria miniovina]
MITIKAQAECMTNLVPAASVPAEKRFVAFLDANSSPALLSLSNAGQLNLILDHTGIPTIADFGAKIGIDSSHAVVAFDARQTADGKLSIAVATDQGGGNYGLSLVSSIAPADLEQDKLPDSAVLRNSQPLPTIYESDFTKNSQPLVFLAFHPPESITKESQLGFVNVVLDTESGNMVLQVDTSWKLATNPQAILAVAFGTCRVGSGAFVLYQSSAGLKLQFRTFQGHNFQVEPVCPAGATGLATYVHPKTGYSVLLVGGDTVTQFTSQEYVSPTSAGTTIIDGAATPGLRGLHASVALQTVSVWFTTKTDSAYCYTAAVDSMASGQLVPLLADGHGGKLSGLLQVSGADQTVVKTLLSADHKGRVTLLQQAPDTKIWRKRPFYAASRTNNVALHGHATRFQPVAEDLNEDQQKAIGFCQLRLASTGYLRAVVNGQVAAVTADGAWFQTGYDGSLTVFSESKDVPSTLVHVTGFKTHAGDAMEIAVDGSSDPTEALVAKLRDIKTGQDLLAAKTQEGESLVPQGSISSADAGKAAAMALDIQKSGGVIRPQGDVFGLLDDVWEAFNYVEEKVKDAADWVVDRVGDAIQLSVTLFGEVYTFVTQTIDSVKKAMSWVLAKVKIGIKKIIAFVGFLFNWDDMLQTADNFAALFNAGLALSRNKLSGLNRDTKAWVKTLRDAVTDSAWVGAGGITDQEVKDGVPKDPKTEIVHGTPYNFSSYHLSHGGALSGATVPDTDDSGFTDLSELFKEEFDKLGTYISSLAGNIKDLLSGTHDSSKIITAIGTETVDLGLGMLADIVDAILGILDKILSLLDTLGNAEVEVPIFTALWKRVTKGRPLTLLNFFSLVLAVPATILYKLVFGTKPPALGGGRLNADTFELYQAGRPIPGDPELTTDIRGFMPASDVVVTHLLAEIGIIFSALDHLDPVGGALAGTNMARARLYQFPVLKAGGVGAAGELFSLPSPLQKLKDIFDGGLLDLISIINNMPPEVGDTETQKRLRWIVSIPPRPRLLSFLSLSIY